MAAVGAASIRVQRPVEGHACDGVERRFAGDFLVRGAVGKMRRIGHRERGADSLDAISDVPGRGSGREIEEERMAIHVLDFRLLFSSTDRGISRSEFMVHGREFRVLGGAMTFRRAIKY